jgi:signal transduction histidine kinase
MFFNSKLNSQFISKKDRKKRNHTLWIFIGTIIFVLLIGYSAVKVYHIAFDETKRNHQLLQKDMADAAAAGIKYYLDNLADGLQLLAAFHRLQKFERDLLRDPVNDLYNHAKEYGAKTIFVANIDTEIIYSTTPALPSEVKRLLHEQIDWVRNPGNWGTAWYSTVLPEEIDNSHNELYFLILVPLIKDVNHPLKSKTEQEPVGFIGEVVSFNWIIKKYITPINLGSSVAAWIMDNQGRLLFHPEHPEMVLRDILKVSPDCQSCHVSFDVQNQMIASEAAYGELTVGEEPTKIISHVPIQFQDEHWILVISSNLSEVTSILRTRFNLFFIIIQVIVVTIIVVGYLLYFINTKRIRAEEERRLIEQKELLHQQICHASKLASIGELVDTVAHEINTPVGIIVAQIQALNLKNNEDSKIFSEEIEIIKQQTKRISNYTHRLLNYSKIMPFQPKPLDLQGLFDDCLFLLGHRLRANNIKIIKNYASDLPPLRVDRSQMEQVFINLLNNAIDSIHGSGEIKIEMEKKNREKISGVEIKIADSGVGIADDLLPKIFNPFFTTKKSSKGTGLGLSISKAIIQRHGGKISADSKIGKGTIFNIFLPLNYEA